MSIFTKITLKSSLIEQKRLNSSDFFKEKNPLTHYFEKLQNKKTVPITFETASFLWNLEQAACLKDTPPVFLSQLVCFVNS